MLLSGEGQPCTLFWKVSLFPELTKLGDIDVNGIDGDARGWLREERVPGGVIPERIAACLN